MTILGIVKGDPSLPAKFDVFSSLLTDIIMDSLEIIRFLLMLEEELDIQIDFESLETSHLQSVNNLANFLQAQDPTEAGAY